MIYRLLILGCGYLLILPTLFGQSENTIPPLEGIVLSVGVPTGMEHINSDLVKKLGNRTKQIATRNGLGATGSQQFMLYPEFEVTKLDQAGQMVSITNVEAEVTFHIKQLDNNYIFASESVSVRRGGRSKKSALEKAILNIDPSSAALHDFIVSAKKKIVAYYQQNCDHFIRQAKNAGDQQQYETALATLATVPTNLPCSQQAQDEMLNIYYNYQQQNCKEWLQLSKTHIAANHYATALSILAKIDPSTYCFAEVQDLIERINNEVDAEKRLKIEQLQQRYQDQIQMEAFRLEVIRDIAVARYEHQPADGQQFILIRWVLYD